jgi:hypothetical protein
LLLAAAAAALAAAAAEAAVTDAVATLSTSGRGPPTSTWPCRPARAVAVVLPALLGAAVVAVAAAGLALPLLLLPVWER